MARTVPEGLEGRRFGKLVALRETRHSQRAGRFYECKCDCGAEILVYAGHLRNGSRVSCGCSPGANRTHRMSHSPEYRAWENARSRCNNPKNSKYELYGARGITMDSAWEKSFENFFAELGPRPGTGYSLDRVDGGRGYEPGNCRWATINQQNRNRTFGRPGSKSEARRASKR